MFCRSSAPDEERHKVMKRRNVSLIPTLIFLLFVASCGEKSAVVCGISDVSQKGINFVQPTIEALEKYKRDNGKYPADVFQLMPAYIDKIPIVLHEKAGVDETKYKILVEEKLKGGVPRTAADGKSYSVEFIPSDERMCATGRNNICEYSSEKPFWDCHE